MKPNGGYIKNRGIIVNLQIVTEHLIRIRCHHVALVIAATAAVSK